MPAPYFSMLRLPVMAPVKVAAPPLVVGDLSTIRAAPKLLLVTAPLPKSPSTDCWMPKMSKVEGWWLLPGAAEVKLLVAELPFTVRGLLRPSPILEPVPIGAFWVSNVMPTRCGAQ